MTTTTHIVKGIAIQFKNQPWLVVDAQFVSPGKGSAFTRTKIKNLKNDQVIEHTFRSGEAVEVIDIARNKCQYLYSNGSDYHFMDNTSYEQFQLTASSLGDTTKYLIEDTECYALYLDGVPVSVQLPEKMTFTVTETTPGCKGDTATGGNKEATIETGTVIKVPLFIKEGEKVVVNTATGTYVSKG